MENTYNELSRRTSSLQGDKLVRLRERPQPWSSSTASRASGASQPVSMDESYGERDAYKSRARWSDDEIRLTPESHNPESPPRHAPQTNSRTTRLAEVAVGDGFLIDGKWHREHPKYKASKAPLPSFKKKSRIDDSTSELPPSSSAPSSSAPRTTRPPIHSYKDETPTEGRLSTRHGPLHDRSSNRRLTPPPPRPLRVGLSHKSGSQEDMRDRDELPVAFGSPKAARKANGVEKRQVPASFPLDTSPADRNNEPANAERTARKQRTIESSDEEESSAPNRPLRKPSVVKRKYAAQKPTQRFPVSPPHAKHKGQSKAQAQDDPFEGLNTLASSSRTHAIDTFPLSPPRMKHVPNKTSLPASSRKGKEKAREEPPWLVDVSEDNSAKSRVKKQALKGKKIVAQAFPMATQMLETIGDGSNYEEQDLKYDDRYEPEYVVAASVLCLLMFRL
jgi:hypothetical protein